MNFEYARQSEYTNDIEIDTIGNCAIRGICCVNEMYYICIVRTSVGLTELFESGPYLPDGTLSTICETSYQKIEYDERKIKKFISSFLQAPRKPSILNIYQAEQISIEEALDSCIDIFNYMKQNQGEKKEYENTYKRLLR